MIRLLAAVGRFVTVVSALVIIAAAAAFGWVASQIYPVGDYLGENLQDAHDIRTLMTVAGGAVGLLVAGTIYGLFAAVYDTQRLVRRLVESSERCEALLRSNRGGNP
jgi:hypothetical protein